MSDQSAVPALPSSAVAEQDGSKAKAAFGKLLPLFRAMSFEEYKIPVTVDLPKVVTALLGAKVARIQAVRPDVARIVNPQEYSMEKYDLAQDALRATVHAHLLYTTSYGPAPQLEKLFRKNLENHAILDAVVTACVRRGLLSAEPLAHLEVANGYRNVAFNNAHLSQLLRADWERVGAHSGLPLSEVNVFIKEAEELSEAIGLREKAPAAIAAASEDRQRAFNFLLDVWDHVARGVTFARWKKGDVQELVPSLYSLNLAGSRKQPNAPTAPVEPPAVEPTQPAMPAPGAAAANNKIGSPNSDPFAGSNS